MERGVLSSGATVLLMRVAGLMSVPLLLRSLTLPLYGAWAVAAIFVNSQGLIDLGMAASTAKYVAQADAQRDRAATRRVVIVSVLLYTGLSLLVAAAVVPMLTRIPGWIGVPLGQQGDAQLLFIGAIGLFALSNYANVAGAVLQGLQRMPEANIAVMASQPIYVGGLFLTWQAHWGSRGVIASAAGMYAVQTIVMVAAARRHMPVGPSTGPFPPIREYFGYGVTLQFAVVVDFIVFQAPKLVAATALGAAAAARVDIAMRLPIASTAVALPLLPPLVPAAARLTARGDRVGLSFLYARATRYLVSVAVPSAATIVVFGPTLLVAWLGNDASGLDLPVRLFGLAFLAHTLCGVAAAVASGAGRPRYVAQYKGVLLVVTAAALALTAAAPSLAGVAAALVVGFSSGTAFFFWRMGGLVSRASSVAATDALLRSLAAAAVSGAVAGGLLVAVRAAPLLLRDTSGALVMSVTYVLLAKRLGVLGLRDVVTAVHSLGRPRPAEPGD